MAAKKYTALTGLNTASGERVDAGGEVFLEDHVAETLVAEGVIEHVSETHKRPEDDEIKQPESDPPVVKVTD